jgi:predicted TIM-barrel fold metal-dependent hydrolase
MTRREWLSALGTAMVGGSGVVSAAQRRGTAPPRQPAVLDLKDFQPRSMLAAPATRVPRARVAAIDCHAHFGYSAASTAGVAQGEDVQFLAPAEQLVPVMDRVNLRMMVNLTGGVGRGLQQSIGRYQTPHPDRFLTFAEPRWSRIEAPAYAREQADEIERAHQLGARGLKVLKTLGLYLRERVTSGPLIAIDDRRFDPMWDACGALKMPVAIHIADPEAFFLPIDRFNERFEELNNHPDWSFYGRDFPSFQSLIDARNRVLARHPGTKFLALHLGNHAENLGAVSECLDRYPNMHVETGARVGELGRQPRAARRFFDRYQDRILFGTDAVPHADDMPQQIFGEALYEIYFRFLETEDEYFDYAPAATPPQGRWRISGIGLPESILRKVYHDNAARLLGLAS